MFGAGEDSGPAQTVMCCLCRTTGGSTFHLDRLLFISTQSRSPISEQFITVIRLVPRDKPPPHLVRSRPVFVNMRFTTPCGHASCTHGVTEWSTSNVDTINDKHCTTLLLYFNLRFTATCFDYYIWPSAALRIKLQTTQTCNVTYST